MRSEALGVSGINWSITEDAEEHLTATANVTNGTNNIE